MTDGKDSGILCRFAFAWAVLCMAAWLGAQTPAVAPGPAKPAGQTAKPEDASAPGGQAPSAQQQEWKTYNYPADGFRASYPSLPEAKIEEVPTEVGAFQLHTYVAQVLPVALFIGVCDYGAQGAKSDPAGLLEGAKNGAVANFSSHLLSERKIALGVNPGVAFEAESDVAHLSARIYLAGTVLYQTMVVTPLGKPYPDTARFLDSFQLLGRGAS